MQEKSSIGVALMGKRKELISEGDWSSGMIPV
jgi:hypothetical protein